MKNDDVEGADYYIPDFLIKPKEPKSEIAMKPETLNDEPAVEEVAEAPVTAPVIKPNGHKPATTKAKAKPARVATPKAAKATSKPRKVKAAPSKAKAKPLKAQPRKLDPSKRDEYGLLKGSIKSKAAAMYASKKGATLGEVKNKLGSIQFNVLTQLGEAGYKIKRTEETGDNNRPVTRFFLT